MLRMRKNVDYHLLSTTQEIKDLAGKAKQQGLIGLDTEFMRESTYFTQLCLLQVSIGTEYFLIDCLAVAQNSEIQALISDLLLDSNLVKILHSSYQDIEVLAQDFKVSPKSIFDTQLAAGFCGFDGQVGYANLVAQVCGAELDKSQTRTKWQQRPLSEKQLEYAVNDVVYLQALYDKFMQDLKDRDRLDWFLIESDALISSAIDKQRPEFAYQRLNGSHLQANKQALLAFLAQVREEQAQSKNIPRTWIIKDADLYSLAHYFPTSLDELKQIEIQSKFVLRNAKKIVEYVNALPADVEQIWETPMPLSPEQKQQVKKMSSAMGQLSEQTGIARSLIANRKDIEAYISGRDAKFEKGWRAEVLKSSTISAFQEFV